MPYPKNSQTPYQERINTIQKDHDYLFKLASLLVSKYPLLTPQQVVRIFLINQQFLRFVVANINYLQLTPPLRGKLANEDTMRQELYQDKMIYQLLRLFANGSLP